MSHFILPPKPDVEMSFIVPENTETIVFEDILNDEEDCRRHTPMPINGEELCSSRTAR